MSLATRFPIVSLALFVAVPLAWLACGGESKPAESPSSETSSDAAPAESETPAPAASASSAPEPEAPAASATAEAPAAAPSPPMFSSTDCGACVDKACAKPEAACGKNSDCQTMLDGIHSCTSGGASCVTGATAPTAPKPKKLAGAVEACAKHAIASKACKAKCQ